MDDHFYIQLQNGDRLCVYDNIGDSEDMQEVDTFWTNFIMAIDRLKSAIQKLNEAISQIISSICGDEAIMPSVMLYDYDKYVFEYKVVDSYFENGHLEFEKCYWQDGWALTIRKDEKLYGVYAFEMCNLNAELKRSFDNVSIAQEKISNTLNLLNNVLLKKRLPKLNVKIDSSNILINYDNCHSSNIDNFIEYVDQNGYYNASAFFNKL